MKAKKNEFSPLQISMLCKELGMFFSGGVPLADAFFIMEEHTSRPQEAALYHSLAEKLETGSSLTDTLRESGRFPDHMLQMTRVGEESGKLEEVFAALSAYYLRQDHLKSSIRSALLYPLIMVFAMLVILAVLLIKILPVFSQVFDQVGARLPVFLKAIADSSAAATYICLIILAIIVIAVVVFLLLRRSAGGQARLTRFYERFPLTRKIAALSQTNQIAYSLSLLLSSGINADESTGMVLEMNRSESARAKLQTVKDLMDEGKTFSQALRDSRLLSPEYAAVVAVGEKTGNVDEMMDLTAQRCSDDTDRKIERLLASIEPAIVIIMCLIIGAVLLSVMLPLMQIMTSM